MTPSSIGRPTCACCCKQAGKRLLPLRPTARAPFFRAANGRTEHTNVAGLLQPTEYTSGISLTRHFVYSLIPPTTTKAGPLVPKDSFIEPSALALCKTVVGTNA